MENIRLSRNELLQQARKVKVIKDEIDKILKETTNTYQILGRISEVSTFLAKRDLDNVRNTANKVSREFENLCLNINNAVKTYDQKEKEINKLAQIKKNQIVTNTISKNQYISNVYSIGKNIQFKINSKRNLGSLIKTKSILKVDTKNIISTVGVGKEIPIDIVLNITLVKSKDILLNIGKTISKLSNFEIKNISGVKPVKDKIIKPIIEVSNIYDKLIGKAVKYSKEIVSIVEDKAKSQLEKVKEKVNEVWDSIPDTIESLKKKVIGKGKELLDDFKGLVNNLKEGLLDFFKISKKIIIGIIGAKISYMMAAYNTITQALIGIIAGVGYLGGMIFGVSPSENSFSKWVETWRGGVSNFFNG